MVVFCLAADLLRATKGVEGVILGSIARQELSICFLLHQFLMIDLNLASVHCVSRWALVAHTIGITDVDSCTVTHETIHGLH